MESAEDKISPEKKKRIMKTPSQLEVLEEFYGQNRYPSGAMSKQLSIQLGLSKQQVVAWFAHRRTRDKNVMNEEASDSGKQVPNGGKEVDNQSYLTSKQSGNAQAMNATNISAILLPSVVRDSDLFAVDHDNIEQTFARSSQERSSLPFGNPKEIRATRCFSHNGNRSGVEGMGKKREVFHMDPRLQENYEHAAIIAVKKHLGEEYRDDGPPLSVEFDLIPPRAFHAPIGRDTGDFHRRLNMVKGYNVLEGDSFDFPKLNSSAESPCSGFSRERTMPGRIGMRYKEMSIAYPYNDVMLLIKKNWIGIGLEEKL